MGISYLLFFKKKCTLSSFVKKDKPTTLVFKKNKIAINKKQKTDTLS